jgi:hypothetical protein
MLVHVACLLSELPKEPLIKSFDKLRTNGK